MSVRPLPEHPRITVDPEICAAYAADASGLSRVPDGVARPESEAEVAELLRLCHERRIGVTPQGLRSSTTGASVAGEGIVLSMEKMTRLITLDPAERFAVVEPGLITADFKRAVRAAGLFYPVDPTSEEECTLGGTVACDASGSRTYRYGPTRGYVRALRVVLADGSLVEARGIRANKNSAGYAGLQNPVDLWIGSEGTLGVVTRVELELLPQPPGFYGALAFFRSLGEALRFVQSADCARREGRLSPRCLELFDANSLELIRPEAGGLRMPPGAAAAIFFEEEAPPEGPEASMERWLAAIEEAGGMGDDTLVAATEGEQAALRKLRHALPAEMNERGARVAPAGGRKVSTDFAVPLEALPEMMEQAYRTVREVFAGFFVAYGHVGNGHPHFNLLAENPAELAQAKEAGRRLARRALELGGTLAAEHGIGKLKVDLFRELYPGWLYDSMLAVKRRLDPRGILSPGNLFSPQDRPDS
jgi:glycolate oxidase